MRVSTTVRKAGAVKERSPGDTGSRVCTCLPSIWNGSRAEVETMQKSVTSQSGQKVRGSTEVVGAGC
ncbi:unnamed protein product [Protopolystoma xenopodis]|uniref:Uncharacterized protein n=1 Tax=Protopolystoma xenopodis TaxID=117903 RepID=A0A448WKT1_9PLAT|nr:unnamed protein product [Protopolystoma xenopodis]